MGASGRGEPQLWQLLTGLGAGERVWGGLQCWSPPDGAARSRLPYVTGLCKDNGPIT